MVPLGNSAEVSSMFNMFDRTVPEKLGASILYYIVYVKC